MKKQQWKKFLVLGVLVLQFQAFAFQEGPLASKVAPMPAEGIWMDTCFSPEEACDQKLIRFIASANVSLQIAIYSLTHKGITQAIVDASKDRRFKDRIDSS